MIEILPFTGDEEAEDDFAVVVEAESAVRHGAVEFDRRHARFIYGPRSFASREDALRTACHWAAQYGLGKVYIH